MGTNKKANGPCFKNNSEVNQSNAKMTEFIYISRPRSRLSNFKKFKMQKK